MRQRWADGWSHYLSGGVCHPYAAPCLCSRLAGVAPALVMSAEDDPLRDEALGYADCLRAAGVKVRQHVLPAGAGWPEIYGGSEGETPGWSSNRPSPWQEEVGRQFSGFVQDISIL